ncbi:MAG: 4Fe-4S dicluster domain-containing protein [Deltaproteobacteria bacterium]|nr:4Fe-4S dicluster domain-containing protein [Deltaproteobacteria bacterium]
MNRYILGQTGIEVSELCFGALPMGPLQKKISPDEGAAIILQALAGGVNFIDTAELYQTYEPISRALRQVSSPPVIASKSMATDYRGMRRAVEDALEALGLDYLDIFHLHAARVAADEDVFVSRKGAFEALLDCRRENLIRAVGISSHSVPTIQRAAMHPEIDVIFPIINRSGTGILYGDVESMTAAINLGCEQGKGLYLMKALGGGCLVKDYHQAMSFVRNNFHLPIAVGMVSRTEVEYNLAYFNENRETPLPAMIIEEKCFQVVEFLCKNCGDCIEACPNQAIRRPTTGEKPVIDPELCLRCGYCVGHCPQFAIRMT